MYFTQLQQIIIGNRTNIHTIHTMSNPTLVVLLLDKGLENLDWGVSFIWGGGFIGEGCVTDLKDYLITAIAGFSYKSKEQGLNLSGS